jgi:hypothetical protein
VLFEDRGFQLGRRRREEETVRGEGGEHTIGTAKESERNKEERRGGQRKGNRERERERGKRERRREKVVVCLWLAYQRDLLQEGVDFVGFVEERLLQLRH